jgi:hypothetical protein
MPEDWSVLSRVPLPSVRDARERLEQPESRDSRSQEDEQGRDDDMRQAREELRRLQDDE